MQFPKIGSRRILVGTGVLLALIGMGGAASAQQPGSLAPSPGVVTLQAHVDKAPAAGAPARITNLPLPQEHTVDMGQLGIRPLAQALPIGNAPAPARAGLRGPDTATFGVGNALMVASPDVVSQTTTAAFGTLMANFTPGETINYYLNGTLALSPVADSSGRSAVAINTGAGLGYITVESIGQTSGKRAGAVIQVLDNAPPVPGFASAPHAVNSSAGGTFYAYGFRWPASTSGVVNWARNGTVQGTFTTSASGRFFVAITPANNGDTSAVYTAYTSTVGSMAGTSVEERSDAGTPPQGDNNAARALVDRPILPASSGGVVSIVGEGFQAGENVNVTGCATGAVGTSANGSVGFFLTYGAASGVSNCVLTGATSGRVARASIQLDANAINAPSGIASPSSVSSGAASFDFLFNRLLPNQNGSIYLDGVSQGAASTDANGKGSSTVTAPSSVGIHEVAFVGSSGQIAIGALYVVPAPPTATVTDTPASTATPTVTPTCASGLSTFYTYSVSAGATIVPGTTDTGNHTDDGSTVITLPFSYTLYDQTYSQVAVGSNGHLTFGTVSNAFNPSCIPIAGTTYAILPFRTDQCTGPCTGVTGTNYGIFTSTSGTAPNRVFNIEYRTAYYNSGGTGLALNYEIRLYEGQTRFDVIYATVPNFTPPAQRNLSVGVQKDTTAGNYTLEGCDTTGGGNLPVSAGQMYTYVLNTSCGTPTVTLTPTSGATNTATATSTSTSTSTITATATATATACTPSEGAWATMSPLPITDVRYAFAQTASSFYVLGGVSGGTRVSNVYRYDVGPGTWTALANIPVASEGPAAALLNNKIYLAEGDTGNSFQIYDIGTNTWTTGTPVPGAANRYGAAAGAYNNLVYIIGGSSSFQSDVQIFNTTTNTWSAGTSAANPLLLPGYQQVGQYLYVVGGFSGTPLDDAGASSVLSRKLRPAAPAANNPTTLRLDMATGTWSNGPAFTPGRADFALAYRNNKLYAIGGDATGGAYFDSTNLVDELDLTSWPSGTWTASPPLLPAPPRQANQAGFTSGNTIWSTGGIDGSTFQFLSDHLARTATVCGTPTPTASATTTLTNTPTITSTATRTATVTNTSVPPTSTATRTATVTNTSVAATSTSTQTSVAATSTSTQTGVAATSTSTQTGVAATATDTAVVPTVTSTATITRTPCPITFTDVTDPTAYYYEPVYYLACRGVVSGYADGTFRPFNNTTRGQMAKIIILAESLPIQTPAAGGYTFADAPPTDTFFSYIETAVVHSLIGGYPCGGVNPQTGVAETCDGNSRPYYRGGNFVTRGQLTKIVVGAAVQIQSWTLLNPATASFTDVPVGSTFYQYIETAVCHHVLGGYSDGTFKPNNNAFRGQIAKIVYNTVTDTTVGCGP